MPESPCSSSFSSPHPWEAPHGEPVMNGPGHLRTLSFLVLLAAAAQPGCGGCSGNGGGDGDAGTDVDGEAEDVRVDIPDAEADDPGTDDLDGEETLPPGPLCFEHQRLDGPNGGNEQTASLVLDIDGDGVNDFVVAERTQAPSVVGYRRSAGGWERVMIDDTALHVEAGGAAHDIDGDGDADILFGGDWASSQVWWWENPSPALDASTPWTRRLVKDGGETKHHDEMFGDVDGDGEAELVFWNQGARSLMMAEIPADPRSTEPWPASAVYTWEEGDEHEGLALADVDGDGTMDIIGGGRWFKRNGPEDFTPNVIDDAQRTTRAAAGQIVEGGGPEVLFVAGEAMSRLRWYEGSGEAWTGRDFLDEDVDHGHSLQVLDVDGDGHDDVFSGEMRLDGGNPDAMMRLLLGDGAGTADPRLVASGYDNHESRMADLDGDGDADILGKPYNGDAPGIDVWLNCTGEGLSLDAWRRHVIDPERPWRAVFISSADIDGDGLRDIVTGGWWYGNPGSPDGTWERTELGGTLYNMAALLDADADGDMDVLGTRGQGADANADFSWARNDGGGSLTILDNVQSGEGDFLQGACVASFSEGGPQAVALSWHEAGHGIQMLTVPPDPAAVAWSLARISDTSLDEALSCGDIDRDGDTDLLLGTLWLRNEGGGSWPTMTLSDNPGSPDRNRLADIDGDGRLDAVVGYEAISIEGLLAWYGQPEAAADPWTEHVISDTVVGPMSIDVADMDEDGDVDVVAGEHNLDDPASARLLVFENADGAGGAWEVHLAATGDEHHDGAHVADMDGDGDLDIISIGWGHANVLLYENLSR